MKVGILTFHRSYNYGAVIQCFALKKFIESLGHDVSVIDYTPPVIRKNTRLINTKTFRTFVSSVLTIFARMSRYKKFKRFVKRLNLTYNWEHDATVIGSDQVGNMDIADYPYLGIWTNKNIGYAISFGDYTSKDRYLKEYHKNFIKVSFREDVKWKPIVADPCFLSPESLNEIAVKPKVNNYLLLYYMKNHKDIISIAKDTAKSRGLRYIRINPQPLPFRFRHQRHSPEEFLGMIKYASYVVTTSYHGVVLAKIFGVPYYCPNLDTRTNYILNNEPDIEKSKQFLIDNLC